MFEFNLLNFLLRFFLHPLLGLVPDLLGHLLLLIVLLGIEKSVGQQQLLRVDLVVGADLFSVEGLGPEAQLGESVLEPH